MIINEPSLYLVGLPDARHSEIRRFLDDHGHEASTFDTDHDTPADLLAAFGGRLCYDSFSKGRPPDEYLPHIMQEGHWSVAEHASFSILFAGVTRSLTHELCRHRHFGYSEQSQRYILVPPRFVRPPLLPDDLVDEWHEAQLAKHRRYLNKIEELRARGVSRKDAHGVARSELPESTETRILVSGNVRAWREMATKRVSPHAEAEIRRAMRLAVDLIRPYTTLLEGV